MNNMVKMIAIIAGGAIVSFGLMFVVFWMVLSPGDEAAMEEPQGAGQQQMAGAQMDMSPEMARQQQMQRVPGGEVLAFADVLGENIPLETSVDGYGWARWGMSVNDVTTRLGEESVSDTVIFRSPVNPEFTSVVALNPNRERNKVEYRFYNNQLFHIEVYYSDFYANESYVSFLLNLMSEYGKPYEISTKVDEMGNVNLHVRWDTEISMIEMVSRPNGQYSLFLDYQMALIELEKLRKSEERLPL
jgi:hypothetical protein